MSQAGTNFHCLPQTCLTVHLIMLNVWVNYSKLLYNRVGVKYFSKYLSQVQVLFHICKYKYKFKYSEYLEDIKYIKYFFNQVRVKYKYFGNKQ